MSGLRSLPKRPVQLTLVATKCNKMAIHCSTRRHPHPADRSRKAAKRVRDQVGKFLSCCAAKCCEEAEAGQSPAFGHRGYCRDRLLDDSLLGTIRRLRAIQRTGLIQYALAHTSDALVHSDLNERGIILLSYGGSRSGQAGRQQVGARRKNLLLNYGAIGTKASILAPRAFHPWPLKTGLRLLWPVPYIQRSGSGSLTPKQAGSRVKSHLLLARRRKAAPQRQKLPIRRM